MEAREGRHTAKRRFRALAKTKYWDIPLYPPCWWSSHIPYRPPSLSRGKSIPPPPFPPVEVTSSSLVGLERGERAQQTLGWTSRAQWMWRKWTQELVFESSWEKPPLTSHPCVANRSLRWNIPGEISIWIKQSYLWTLSELCWLTSAQSWPRILIDFCCIVVAVIFPSVWFSWNL